MDATPPPLISLPSWGALGTWALVAGGFIVWLWHLATGRQELRIDAMEKRIEALEKSSELQMKQIGDIREMVARQPTREDMKDFKNEITAGFSAEVNRLVAVVAR